MRSSVGLVAQASAWTRIGESDCELLGTGRLVQRRARWNARSRETKAEALVSAAERHVRGELDTQSYRRAVEAATGDSVA